MMLISARIIGRMILQGIFLGISVVMTIITFVYATASWGSLPTVNTGSGLTSTAWNDLVTHVNQSVKQTSQVITVNGTSVGIGAPTPSNKFEVASSSSTSTYFGAFDQIPLILRNNDSSNNNWNNIDFMDSTAHMGSVGVQVLNHTTPVADMVFGTTNGPITEKMRITGGGNVGIGTNNPGVKLQVGNSGDGTSAKANSWAIFSDERLKKDFSPLSSILEKLESINGYYYFWKQGSDNSRQIGVKAQEIEKVFPEIVQTGADGYKSVDYGKLSAVLIEAVKELKKENKSLEERIQALEVK